MKYIITLLITALATSLTAAPPEGGKGKKPGGPRKLPPQIVKKFDADGDGVAETVYYNGYRGGEHVARPTVAEDDFAGPAATHHIMSFKNFHGALLSAFALSLFRNAQDLFLGKV